MRRAFIYVILLATLSLCFAIAPAGADTIKLRNGQAVNGKYLGGTDTKIDFLVSGRVQSYNVTEVQSLTFEGKPYGQSSEDSPASHAAATSRPSTATADVPNSSAPPAADSTIPAGTTLVVRMIDGVDSSVNRVGDTFNASLESPLVVGDRVLAPKGADVYGRLIQAQQAGRMQGQAELRLELTGIKIHDRVVPIVTGAYAVQGASRSKNTAEKVGGGAVIGALIGAIASGGKGAAIGAGVGAGAGTAAQVMTHGQQVRVPSETVLDFTIEQPVTIPQ